MPPTIDRNVRPARRSHPFLRDSLVTAAAVLFGITAGGASVLTVMAPSDRTTRTDTRADAAPTSLAAAVTRMPLQPLPMTTPSVAQTASGSFPDSKTAAPPQPRPLPNAFADSTMSDVPAERMRNLFDFFDGSQSVKGANRHASHASSSMTHSRSAAAVARLRAAHRAAVAGVVSPRT